MRLILFLTMFCNPLYSQNIADVYPVGEFDPLSVSMKDSDIVVLKPIPFEITYLIEFKKDLYVSKVIMDRSIDSIELSAYIDGIWICFNINNEQTFIVNQTIRYLMVRYKEDCDKVYLLIE